MKKLSQKLKTSRINVKIEKFLGSRWKSTDERTWVRFKVQPFDYNSKTINKIKIETEDMRSIDELFEEEGGEYVIEAEKIFVKNDQLKIPLLWQSRFIEGELERAMKKRQKK